MSLVFLLMFATACTSAPISPEDFCETFDDKGYLFHNREMINSDAIQFCREKGMTLVNVESDELKKWLVETSTSIEPSVRWWVSFIKPERSRNSSINSVDNCVYIDGSEDAQTDDCGRTHRFICQSHIKTCDIEDERDDVDQSQPQNSAAIGESNSESSSIDQSNNECKIYKNKGYLFNADSLTQSAAEEFCQALGMQLTTIYSSEHNKFLYDNAMKLRKSEWWIGLSSKQLEEEFIWADGFRLTYKNWQEGSPNSTSIDQDCVTIGSSDDGKWTDTACSRQFPFVCEAESNNCSKPNHTELSKLPNGDSCASFKNEGFTFHDIELSFKEGTNYCQSMGMKMAVVTSRDQNKWLSNTASSMSQQGWWLGLYRKAGQEKFLWPDKVPVTFERWLLGEPKRQAGEESCAVFGAQSNEKWTSQSCEKKFRVICQSKSKYCNEEVSSTELAFNSINPQPNFKEEKKAYIFENQNEAEGYCEKLGMNLTAIYSVEQKKWEKGNKFTIQRNEQWTCLNEFTQSRAVTRLDSETPMTKIEQKSNEVNYNQHETTCKQTGYAKKNGKWIKIDCNVRKACPSIPTSCKTEQTSVVCKEYGKRTFYFVNRKMNYETAKKFCHSNGMTLTTIYNSRHNKWIVNSAYKIDQQNRWWIGLSDQAREGRFQWCSGYRLKFQNWHPMEPNNLYNEDCVELLRWITYDWNDASCRNKNAFICESSSSRC